MNNPGKNALTKTALIKFGDIAGMTASVLCLLHCLAMPLVILAFPMLGLAHAHDTFHDTLIAAITLPVLLALVPGYLRHRDKTTLLVGCAGLALFLAAVFIVSPLLASMPKRLSLSSAVSCCCTRTCATAGSASAARRARSMTVVTRRLRRAMCAECSSFS